MLNRLRDPLSILYSLPAILVGLVIHELVHALVADSLGDPTPRRDGRITLNPMAHLDPIGTILLIFMGFGWAKPVRTNPSNFSSRKYGMLLISIAGPLSNLVIAFLSMGIYVIGVNRLGWTSGLFGRLMGQMVFINVLLFILNLIPIPPLDGYQAVKTFLPVRNVTRLWQFEKYGFMLLIILSITGALGYALNAGTGVVTYLFSRFYGLFI